MNEENDLIVAENFAMLDDDISARRHSKAEYRRALPPLLNDRSEGSMEFERQNIRAALRGFRAVKFETNAARDRPVQVSLFRYGCRIATVTDYPTSMMNVLQTRSTLEQSLLIRSWRASAVDG